MLRSVRNILVSVSDKAGLEGLISGLDAVGSPMTLYSTGGTHRVLEKALPACPRLSLRAIEEYTGYPEMPGGLVKTLHPRIHGGLLADLQDEAQLSHMEEQGMIAFDLVVVNLYPFRQTIARAGVSLEDARQQIDIGGPTMLRAAAKNFPRVAVLVDPSDYAPLLAELRETQGATTLRTRFTLARKAFEHVQSYDRAIADYLTSVTPEQAEGSYERS